MDGNVRNTFLRGGTCFGHKNYPSIPWVCHQSYEHNRHPLQPQQMWLENMKTRRKWDKEKNRCQNEQSGGNCYRLRGQIFRMVATWCQASNGGLRLHLSGESLMWFIQVHSCYWMCLRSMCMTLSHILFYPFTFSLLLSHSFSKYLPAPRPPLKIYTLIPFSLLMLLMLR